MAKKSVSVLIFLSMYFSVFAISTNHIWEDFPNDSNQQDTTFVVPMDYEKSVSDMMNDWYLSRTVIQQCNRNSITPVYYSDSVYISRLQRLPYKIEMPYNNVVKRFIDMYANRIRQVEYMIGLGKSYYFPIFEQALAKYNLPLELKYLPIIESALNSKAISRAGAGGLWQFMVSTGKIYDLEINSLVDDRFDPRKASEAAARYLNDLYTIYNDWHLVIAAYNCGPGNVARAIRKSGGKTGYWEIYPYLPRETRGYVPIFIAANYIMNYYNAHNICPAIPTFIHTSDTVMVSKRVHLQQISEILSIPMEELQFLNPQYKHDIVPGDIKPYAIVLPFDKIANFSTNFELIIAYKADELIKKQVVVKPAERKSNSKSYSSGKYKYYKVKSGDTLGAIARRYGTSVSKIKRVNGLSSDRIRIGQRLKIPK